MEVGVLLVGEEEVGLPQTLKHVGVHRQRVTLEVCGQAESRVIPPLTQEDVDPVVLRVADSESETGSASAAARWQVFVTGEW